MITKNAVVSLSQARDAVLTRTVKRAHTLRSFDLMLSVFRHIRCVGMLRVGCHLGRPQKAVSNTSNFEKINSCIASGSSATPHVNNLNAMLCDCFKKGRIEVQHTCASRETKPRAIEKVIFNGYWYRAMSADTGLVFTKHRA